jgi:hypothetical protein
LEVAKNGMVDGEIAVEHLLQVLADIAQPKMQALEGLQLRGYACGKGTDGNVTDIAEEVFDTNFFGFLGFDH